VLGSGAGVFGCVWWRCEGCWVVCVRWEGQRSGVYRVYSQFVCLYIVWVIFVCVFVLWRGVLLELQGFCE
jgi:hypothetical protein